MVKEVGAFTFKSRYSEGAYLAGVRCSRSAETEGTNKTSFVRAIDAREGTATYI